MSTPLTASYLPIAAICGWAFDPQNIYPEPEREAPEADLGSAVHKCMQCHISTSLPTPIEIISKRYNVSNQELNILYASAVGEYERIPRPNVKAEAAYGWNPDDGARCLGLDLNRGYEQAGAKPEDVCGSFDLIHQDATEPSVWVLVDYKAGWAAHVEEPQENWQLKFGAMCLAQDAWKNGVELSSVRIETWKVRPDRTWVDSYVMDRLELTDMARQMTELVGRIADSEAVASPKCQFCPALGACPTTVRGLTEMAAVEPQLFPFSLDIQSVEHAGYMAENLSNLKKAVEGLKSVLEKYAKKECDGAIPLASGKVWRCCPFSKKQLSQKALKEALGEEEVKKYMHQVEVRPWRVAKR